MINIQDRDHKNHANTHGNHINISNETNISTNQYAARNDLKQVNFYDIKTRSSLSENENPMCDLSSILTDAKLMNIPKMTETTEC